MKTYRGGLLRHVLALVIITTSILIATSARAAVFDPQANWQTIKTTHFNIHYPKRIEVLAKKSAIILENVYPEVTEKWDWKPWGPTETILVDSTDSSNGMAAVLPYNWMLVYAVPPDPDSSLAHHDDWLKMLLVHEFTHIVQLDAYGGAWIPFRLLLQKTVSPSGIDPTWMKEGIAQYDETIFTEGGRGRGTYSDMVVRTSIFEDTFPPIDKADGLSWQPPGYKTAYVYGIKFVQWLTDTYGEEKFLEFDKRVRKSLLLGMINHQARNVYGKTFYELWREWEQYLIGEYDVETASIVEKGVSPYSALIPSKDYEQYYAPALSPDGTKIVYTTLTPFGPPEIRLTDLEKKKTKVLKKSQTVNQFSWSPDSTKIAYSTMASYKRYYRYYDLWLYDLTAVKKKDRVKRLTTGQRAKSPDFTPDGKSLVFVKHDKGTDGLAQIDIESKKIRMLTHGVTYFTQFDNPRVSHDGNFIAVSQWSPETGWRVYRYDVDGSNPKALTKAKGLVIQSRPDWSHDDSSIIYSSDESGISNIYRVSSLGGKSDMITNVLTGVFQPIYIGEQNVIAQRYHSKGFEIAEYIVEPAPDNMATKYRQFVVKHEKTRSRRIGGGGEKELVLNDKYKLGDGLRPTSVSPMTELMDSYNFNQQRYVAFGRSLFLPRFVIPNAAYADDALFLSIFTGGMDPLRWHRWMGGATYRTDAKHVGYFFNYSYNRFKPSFGAGIRDFSVDFGNLSFVDAAGNITNTIHFYEHRRAFFTYVGYPWKKMYFTLAYYFEDHMPKNTLTAGEQAALNLGHFGGIRLQYKYGDAKKFAASISKESGRIVRLFTSVTDKCLGAAEKNEQIIFAGDWREYIKLFKRNVIALRAAGGMTWGDTLVQGTFGMGGAIGEGTLASGGSYTYFPFRGLPVSALSRNRAMLFSAEYRFPILDPLRGIGTIPVFLKDISGALLVDYGNAWNPHENGSDRLRTFFDEFMLSIGAELRADFYIGHGLPVHGRLGYAIIVVNRDRVGNMIDPLTKASVSNGMVILALGTSF